MIKVFGNTEEKICTPPKINMSNLRMMDWSRDVFSFCDAGLVAVRPLATCITRIFVVVVVVAGQALEGCSAGQSPSDPSSVWLELQAAGWLQEDED